MEQTIKALLDEEADELVGAERYERTASRDDGRSGHYKRKLATTSGQIELSVPKLRGATFQTAVIERYRRREMSVEEWHVRPLQGDYPLCLHRWDLPEAQLGRKLRERRDHDRDRGQ